MDDTLCSQPSGSFGGWVNLNQVILQELDCIRYAILDPQQAYLTGMERNRFNDACFFQVIKQLFGVEANKRSSTSDTPVFLAENGLHIMDEWVVRQVCVEHNPPGIQVEQDIIRTVDPQRSISPRRWPAKGGTVLVKNGISSRTPSAD